MTKEELTAQLDDIKTRVDNLEKKLAETLAGTRWKPQSNSSFYSVGVDAMQFHNTSDDLISTAYDGCNCFRTKEEAERELSITRVWRKARWLRDSLGGFASSSSQSTSYLPFRGNTGNWTPNIVYGAWSEEFLFNSIDSCKQFIAEMGADLDMLFPPPSKKS